MEPDPRHDYGFQKRWEAHLIADLKRMVDGKCPLDDHNWEIDPNGAGYLRCKDCGRSNRDNMPMC